MPKRPDWRSPNYVDALKQLDRAGFAWEFLRRNPTYREDYENVSKDPEDDDTNKVAVGHPWGLSFRLRSHAPRFPGIGGLAAGTYPSRGDAGPGTGRLCKRAPPAGFARGGEVITLNG
jgi:hypothetical protein